MAEKNYRQNENPHTSPSRIICCRRGKGPGVRIIRAALHSPFYFVFSGAPLKAWPSPDAGCVQASKSETPCCRLEAGFSTLPPLLNLFTHFPFSSKVPYCPLICSVIDIVLLQVARLCSAPHTSYLPRVMLNTGIMKGWGLGQGRQQHCFSKNSALLTMLARHLDFIKVVKTFCKGTFKRQCIAKPLVRKCQGGESSAFEC